MKTVTAELRKEYVTGDPLFKVSLGPDKPVFCDIINTEMIPPTNFIMEVGKDENDEAFQLITMSFPDNARYRVEKNGKKRSLVFFKSNGNKPRKVQI